MKYTSIYDITAVRDIALTDGVTAEQLRAQLLYSGRNTMRRNPDVDPTVLRDEIREYLAFKPKGWRAKVSPAVELVCEEVIASVDFDEMFPDEKTVQAATQAGVQRLDKLHGKLLELSAGTPEYEDLRNQILSTTEALRMLTDLGYSDVVNQMVIRNLRGKVINYRLL